jgi:3-phenylpropionate/trans-cinnamate dioxygenase ferredoxin component
MKTFWRWAFSLIGLTVLIMPAVVFFGQRGPDFLNGQDQAGMMLAIFPLISLYAFTLLWFQFMLGSLMPWWRRLWPRVETWHRTQGVFVFLLAILHPSLLLAGVGLTPFLANSFVDPRLSVYVLLGKIALLLLTLTVLTALLRKTSWVKRWWRKIHILNYLILAFAWLHAWNLGSDVQSTGLRWLWIGFGLTVISAGLWRLFGMTWSRQTRIVSSPAGKFVSVAKLEHLREGQPFCAQFNGRAIALFRFGQEVYAINNACNHAGGSLCHGQLSGDVIECPLHFSRYNVKNGAYIDGPATGPQTTYRVRINGNNVQVAAA